MIIPVVYGKAVIKPFPVYRYDAENRSYFAYGVCENTVSSITLYASGAEYDGSYTVSHQGAVNLVIPDDAELHYPHINSLLAEFPASLFEEYGSREIDVACLVDGSVIYDLVTGTMKASYNPVNFIYDYLTNTKYGIGIDPLMLNTASFITEAEYAVNYGLINTCDFGVILNSENTAENLSKLKQHANAVLYLSEGLINIAIRRLRPVSAVIDDEAIVSGIFRKGLLSETIGLIHMKTHSLPDWNTNQYTLDSELDYAEGEQTLEFDYIEDISLPLTFARRMMDQANHNDTLELEILQSGLQLDLYDVAEVSYSELGLSGGRWLVKSISYPTSATVRLTLTPDPESLYENIEGNFEGGDYTIRDNSLKPPAKPAGISTSETVQTLADGSYLTVLAVSWSASAGAASYKVSVINGGVEQGLTVSGLSASFRVVPGSADISVWAVSYAGAESGAETVSVTVSGLPGIPQDVAGLDYVLTREGAVLTWQPSGTADFSHYNVYLGSEKWLGRITANRVVYSVTEAGSFVFKVTVVNRYGRESDGVSVTVNILRPAAVTGIITVPKTYGIGLELAYAKGDFFDGVELWASRTDDLMTAFHLATVYGGYFQHTDLDTVDSYYYWARVKSTFGLYSDWFGSVRGETDADPAKLLEILTGGLTPEQFTSDIRSGFEQIGGLPYIEKAIAGIFAYENDVYEDVYEDSVRDVEPIGPRINLQAQQIAGNNAKITELTLTAEGITQLVANTAEGLATLTEQTNSRYTAVIVDTEAGEIIGGFQMGADPETRITKMRFMADQIEFVNPDDINNFFALFNMSGGQVGLNMDVIIDGSVTTGKLAASSVTTDKLSAEAVTAEKIKVSELEAGGNISIADGSINTPHLKAGAVEGQHIKATTQITLDDGGKIIVGNQNVIIDSAGSGTGSIIIAPDGGTAGQNYASLKNGEVEFYYWDSINSQHVLYKSLRRVETGTAVNNTTVNIPGIFRSQPKVLLSPANLQSYSGAHSAQSQSFLLSVTNMQVANGRWSFKPLAQLVLSASSLTEVYNLTASNTSNNVSFSTAAVSSSGNTVKIAVNVRMKSVRSNGTAGVYQYRAVRWRINYSGGQTAWKIKTLGATLDYVTDTQEVSVSQNTHSVVIEAQCYDAGGTFSTGGAQYEYWNALSDYFDKDPHPVVLLTSLTSKQMILPALSIPSGYSVYEVNWEITYMGYGYVSCGVANKVINRSSSNPAPSGTVITSTSTSWNNTVVFTPSGSLPNMTIQRVKARVYARKAVTSSTTPYNEIVFETATYDITGSTILAEGTVNWMAAGE